MNTNFLKNDHCSLETKILLEKRKRSQIYTNLDYFVSCLTYFDFFSIDTFKILLEAKYLSNVSNKNILTSEYLLLPFFNKNLEISNILVDSNLLKKDIAFFVSKSIDINVSNRFLNYFVSKNTDIINGFDLNIRYSQECYKIFEKAAENSLNRFKTPIINTEILFITLMEEKETRCGKFIKNCIKSDTEWYVLRYKLLKRLHEQETIVRTEIKKNQLYFAYLLKKYIPEFHFQRLIDNNDYEYMSLAVLFFRREIIKSLLSTDLLDNVYSEILYSNKITQKRIYSS